MNLIVCPCCGRPLTEFDCDEVLVDPATGAVMILVAPSDGLCRACSEPETHPITHVMAHEEDD